MPHLHVEFESGDSTDYQLSNNSVVTLSDPPDSQSFAIQGVKSIGLQEGAAPVAVAQQQADEVAAASAVPEPTQPVADPGEVAPVDVVAVVEPDEVAAQSTDPFTPPPVAY